MPQEPALCSDGQFAVHCERTATRLAVTVTGRLDLDSVEDLAACTDQICRGSVQEAVFDVSALTAVDEAGVRTLAAACGCLAAHGVAASIRGVGAELQAMLDRLGLTVPVSADRADRRTVGTETGAAAAR